MYQLLLIGIGGFIGAILLYLIGGWIQNGAATFPLGTLGVNTMGSLVLSMIRYLSEYRGIFSEDTRLFLTICVLGAFTTMSTFSYESFKLLEQKNILLFGTNVIGTVALTIVSIYIGRIIVVSIWRA